ncbi:MAG: hypothetical protein RMJ56_13145 [Gemmataceae bacterium]|nr:hypothetical protein [Gemmata sp.]MDW8198542.1 hypothetical protein [Gemmataceae bacterium]
MISDLQIDSLRQRWQRTIEQLRIDGAAAQPVWEVLRAAYSAPERYYHNLEHLTEMFAIVDRLASRLVHPVAVELAVWFHDAVYDTHATNNEQRSGELAVDLLGPLGVPASTIECIVPMIWATANFQSQDALPTGDTAVLLDADRAILGSAPERYSEYARAIRAEYHWVAESTYRMARAAVLREFLERPRIYATEEIYAERENQARNNLRAELSQWE